MYQTTSREIAHWFAFASGLGQGILWLNFIWLLWFDHKLLIQLAHTTKVKISTFNPTKVKAFARFGKSFMILYMLVSAYSDYLTVFTSETYTEHMSNILRSFNRSWVSGIRWVLLDYRMNFIFCMDAFMIIIPIILILVKVELEQNLKGTAAAQGLRLVRAFRRKVDTVNYTLGGLYLAFYVTVLSHYCELPEVFVSDFVKSRPYTFGIYMVSTSFLWLLGAHFHRSSTRTINRWADDAIYESCNDKTALIQAKLWGMGKRDCGQCSHFAGVADATVIQMNAVRSDLVLEPLAMSCCFFTVTFSFVGSVS